MRWDHRAPRELSGKLFEKGPILSFEAAIQHQLQLMHQDLTSPGLFPLETSNLSGIDISQGSCLDRLPELSSASVDVVVTSPPYCNRYDYTRTYALEFAFLGTSEGALKDLRQALLSCTVENRSKEDELRQVYSLRGNAQLFEDAVRSFHEFDALQAILIKLDQLGRQKNLNNSNVPRMVCNYFLESSLVIFELGRIVKSGGHVVMVNDNVQYGGEDIPVDLILSEIALAAGFSTKQIWVLEKGKGNSSQQMGKHGRNELRKCVYIWQR